MSKLINDNITEPEYNPFDAPIPGQSLTDEPGNYPWEHPPKTTDPEELMLIIMETFNQTVTPIPEPGNFYTFVYNAKTPNKQYDQHPLIACTSLEPWGFKAINFHWRQSRNYTWNELAGQLYIINWIELDELLAIPYAKYILNR